MAVRVIAVVVFLSVVSGSLMIQFRKQNLAPGPKGVIEQQDESDIPKPATGSALPKAVVVGESLHDFGLMAHGEKGEHVFKIRNAGTAPLQLVARTQDHSCQCTLGTVGNKALPPGEETTVKLNWEIKNPSMHFQHWAKIRTNDPDKAGQEVTFRVRGLVVKRLYVREGNEIVVGTLNENKPVTKKITLLSESADSFQLHTAITSSLAMATFIRPLTKEEVDELSLPDREADMRQGRIMPEDMEKMKRKSGLDSTAAALAKATTEAAAPGTGVIAPNAGHDHGGHDHAGNPEEDADKKEFESRRPSVKSGYEISVTLPTTLPVGRFRETVSLQTDLETQPLIVSFQGTRLGPVQILPTPGSGWNPTNSLLHLGRFRASEGKKARLLIFVTKGSEDFKILSGKASPAAVKFQLIKDEKFNGVGREKFDLIIEVPAGADPITADSQNPGSLVLETNHPEASQINLDLDFTSH